MIVSEVALRRIIFNCCLPILLGLAVGFQVAMSETEVVSQMHLIDSERPDYVELTVADESVPALYRRDQTGRGYGAVLLLHDRNGAIDSSGPVSALRQFLPEHGWSVMTVALSHRAEPEPQDNEPTADAENTVNDEDLPAESAEQTEQTDTPPTESETANMPVSDIQRIQAAVIHIQADNPQQLILAGVGAGALEAIKSIATLPMPAAGLVVIQTPELDPLAQNALESAFIPVLDITAGNARQEFQKAARDRAAMMARNQHKGYSQRRLAGASEQFYSQSEAVARMTRNWLYQRFIAPERKP